MENLENVFYYQEHFLLDINSQVPNDSPFTLGVQSEWQLKMMLKFGQKCLVYWCYFWGKPNLGKPYFSVLHQYFMSFNVFHIISGIRNSNFVYS